MVVMDKGKQGKAGRKDNAAPKQNRRKADNMQSKQDLLAALTRQAEVNTRILERERAAVLAMEIQTVESQTQQRHNMHGPGYGPGPGPGRGGKARPPGLPPGPGNAPVFHDPHGRRAGGAPPPANVRTKAGPPGRALQVGQARPGNGRSHVFMDGQKQVYDPSQVPGLMGQDLGNNTRQPWSPFNVPSDPEATMNGPNPLEGTFPDSPGFYPGMIFGVPTAQAMTPPLAGGAEQGRQGPWGQRPGPGGFTLQQQQPQQRGGPSPRGQDSRWQGTLEGPAGGWGQQQQQQGGWNPHGGQQQPQQQQQQQQQQPPQQQFGGWGGGGGNPRDEAAMKRDAYRRELDEQVRSKQQHKEAEKAARRQQEEREEARAMGDGGGQWGGGFGGRGGGGGGEPLRNDMGQPVADLRGGGNRSPGGQQGRSPGPWQAMGPPPGVVPFGFKAPPPNLTVQIPGDGGGFLAPGGFPPGGRPSFQPASNQGPPPGPYAAWPSPSGGGPPNRGGWNPSPSGGGMPPGGPGAPSPGPGEGAAGGRRFMSELRPGPSDDQRRHQEMQRMKLQQDLQEQIRQKKEREARAKAEEEAARRKEEADMQAYYQQMQAQKDAEARARHEEVPKQASPQGMPYQPPPQQQQHLPPPDAGPTHQVGGRRRAKKIIEADWLDKISLPSEPAPQQQQQQQHDTSPGGGMRGVRESAEGPAGGPGYSGLSPGPGGGTRNSTKADISAMLQELQKEQVRLREEFVRQADLVRNMVKSGGDSKDKAHQDLNRIRQQLSEVETAALNATDSLDQFVVSTHLVPRNVNSIPSRLATPLEAEWVRAAMAPGPGVSPRGGMDSLPRVQSYDQGPGYGVSTFHATRGGAAAALPAIQDEDSEFLDCLDQLLGQSDQQEFWQQLQSPQSLQYGGRREAGRNMPGPPYGRPSAYEEHDPGERGLYQPISQLPGPPSLIPRAPRGAPGSLAAPLQVPGSRIAGSFFNLHGQAPPPQQQQQQQQQYQQQQPQRRQAPGRQQSRPPNSPPILRADHLPSPIHRERRLAGPAASRLAGGWVGGGKQAAAAAELPPPRAGRRAGKAPDHVPKPGGAGRLPALSATPHLPALAPPRSSGAVGSRPMEASVPRAASANPRLVGEDESVSALAAAVAGMGTHPSSVE